MSLKIDSHQHFWMYDPVRYSWINESMKSLRRDFFPDDLKPVLKRHGFDGCIAVQADQSEEETEMLLKLATEYKFIKGVVGWVDLTSPDVGESMKYFSENPLFKGVRHIIFDERGKFMLDPAFLKGIARLQEYNLTYDILAFDYQLPGAIGLVKKFSEQPFVLDHMGKPKTSEVPSSEWIRNVEILASCGNVYCKVSGLVTEAENFQWEKEKISPFLDVVCNSFGEDRLMFGSDWPVCLSAATYEEVVKVVEENFSLASKQNVEKIFGANAARFYRI